MEKLLCDGILGNRRWYMIEKFKKKTKNLFTVGPVDNKGLYIRKSLYDHLVVHCPLVSSIQLNFLK